jgi:hypothetical protein
MTLARLTSCCEYALMIVACKVEDNNSLQREDNRRTINDRPAAFP